jgi:hypothetical protein
VFTALNSMVADPTAENTVSNDIVSEENLRRPDTGLASGSQPRHAAAIDKMIMSCLISTY